MFQLRQLKTFVAAAETLSFTRAAERVHLTQPSVTEQIRTLEDAVGRALFVRHRNTLALTDAGRELAARARSLLALADETLHAVQGGTSAGEQRLALVAPETLATALLAPLVARYTREHPQVTVSLQTANSADTAAAVKRGEADLGLLHGGPLPDAALASEVLMHDEPVVVMPAGHALCGSEQVPWRAPSAERLGATAPGCTYRAYLASMTAAHGGGPRVAFEADSVRSLLVMVAAGIGLCVVPRLAYDGASAGLDVQARRIGDESGGLPVCLVTRAHDTQRPAAHAAAIAALLRERSAR
ncbi:MAG: LysR family transcriptional regulator [Rhizobacter sp.]|nr:LysR family transcriptional regulator [Rhizobacter sp.]